MLKENNILKIGEGISQKVGLKYLQDIAKGLGEMHSTKRVHGDLKPDNIAVDGNKLLLTDLGTATNANFGWTVSAPRDNMGFLYVRAPECFVPESHPTTSSDVYSWGSLAYKLFSGEYPQVGVSWKKVTVLTTHLWINTKYRYPQDIHLPNPLKRVKFP